MYRIIEKKGTYVTITEHTKPVEKDCLGYGCDCGFNPEETKYIPRFILQKLYRKYTDVPLDIKVYPFYEEVYEDLKEFTNLEEARAYKRDLDLEDGIIIE